MTTCRRSHSQVAVIMDTFTRTFVHDSLDIVQADFDELAEAWRDRCGEEDQGCRSLHPRHLRDMVPSLGGTLRTVMDGKPFW